MDIALRPDFFNNLPTVIREKQAKESGVTTEELALSTLSNSDGWNILKEYINEFVEDLNKVNDLAIAQGAPKEQIGENAIVVSLAKGVIKRILDKVEDSRQIVEEKNG